MELGKIDGKIKKLVELKRKSIKIGSKTRYIDEIGGETGEITAEINW